jgi:hypothetical protein
MKNMYKHMLSLLYAMVLLTITLSTAQAQWKVSMTYESPFAPGPARGYYIYTKSATGGTSNTRIYNWTNQYNGPHTPVAGTNELPLSFNSTTTPVNVPYGGVGAWDDWKPVLVTELSRKNSLGSAEQVDLYANVHVTIDWDTVNFGPAPPNATFEGRSFASQYKNNLPGSNAGQSTQFINFVGNPYTPQQIIYATIGQYAQHNFWTSLSGFAVIYGGNNALWYSDYVDFVDSFGISHYTYIDQTEQFIGDGPIHGGRVHMPITNGHAVISMGIHQTLDIAPFTFGAAKETQSTASAEFRILPAASTSGG